jgi:hypothetical protein
MTDKQTLKEMLTPTITTMEDNRIRVDIMFKGVEMVSMYFERPKKGWTNKPIMPTKWRCVDTIVSDHTIYLQGMVTPKELVALGQQLIEEAGIKS